MQNPLTYETSRSSNQNKKVSAPGDRILRKTAQRRDQQDPKKTVASSSEKVGREAILHYALCILHLNRSRPMPFQQRTNTSCYLLIPTRGFTAAVSVFGGTPPPKPLNCKIRFALPGDPIDRSWAHHVGDDSMLVLAKFSLSPEDITWMSCYSCSQSANLSLTAIHPVSSTGKTKTLLTFL